MKRALALAAVAVAAAATASASPGDAWKTLRRPLHIPHIAAGSRCPVTSPRRSGPAHPVLAADGIVQFRFPALTGSPAYGSPWTAVSVPWRVAASYRGPLLVRGRQVDGSRVLRFESGQIPGKARWIPAARRPGGRTVHSLLRLRSPGCYAFQVDGLTFSRTIVFKAELLSAGDEQQVVSTLRGRGLAMTGGAEFPSIAFDDFFHNRGHQYLNPQGSIVLWQFPSFEKARSVLIGSSGLGVTLILPNGAAEGASIFCGHAPCSADDVPPVRHWFRSGPIIAVYLGDDSHTFESLETVLGEQFAGTDAPRGARVCRASPVNGEHVDAGVIRGGIDPFTDVLDGRFRLHVGEIRDPATQTYQKILWSAPANRRIGGQLVLRGRTLFGPKRVFVQKFQYAGTDDQTRRYYPSIVVPPAAGCWRLTLTTGKLRNALTVRVDG